MMLSFVAHGVARSRKSPAVKLAIWVAMLLASVEAAADEPAAKIKNPFYDQPAWKLWAVDATPLPALDGTPEKPAAAIVPLESAKRLYPDFTESLNGFPRLRTAAESPKLAGFWDDVYSTYDRNHTSMPGAWSGSEGRIDVSRQFMNLRFMAFPPAKYGVNFTSQSYSHRGRHIVDDFRNNDATERHFFFANCIRATPAYVSFVDDRAEQATDDYDGLFGHSFQGLGQSGSEVHGILKMMLAGGCLSRTAKDQLKQHGAYAIPLLTMFKAALPYCDAAGREVPFESELRHRVAYTSRGHVEHAHFCPANPHFHAYDDVRHMRRMLEMARGMETPPPVAVLKLEDLTVLRGEEMIAGPTTEDSRLKCVAKTLVRIWGNPGETLVATISMADSYDLNDRPLEFSAHVVYPNQKNVEIRRGDRPGQFIIRVTHDPKLPKGRIPVLLAARNGTDAPSNPVFVNFYWPEGDEPDDFGERGGPPGGPDGLEVNRNLRPVVSFDLPHETAQARPNERLVFHVAANDPEGYPVTLYRWPGEVGSLDGDTFTWDVPADAEGVYPLHFLASDGTGGFTGRLVKALVHSKSAAPLADDWNLTATGFPESAGRVSMRDREIQFEDVGPETENTPRRDTGTFAFRAFTGDVDLGCRVQGIHVTGRPNGAARLGVMLRDNLSDYSHSTAVYAVGNSDSDKPLQAAWTTRRQNWNSGSSDPPDVAPNYLRLVRRGETVVTYHSADGKLWRQTWIMRNKVPAETWGGLILSVEGIKQPGQTCRASARCELLTAEPIGLAVITGKGSGAANGRYAIGDTVLITPPQPETAVHYTLDGAKPTAESPKYAGPIPLDEAGRLEVRARCFANGAAGATVSMFFQVE